MASPICCGDSARWSNHWVCAKSSDRGLIVEKNRQSSGISMTSGQFLETPLHQWHVDNGGRMVEFAGWSMPVQYASIVAEHHHTRTKLGLFDVSHMGRLFFSGHDVDQYLDALSTRRIVGVEPGKVRYSLICNDDGTILDDVLIYHLAAGGSFAAGDEQSDSFYMMVCNASNRAKINQWFADHLPAQSNLQIDDRTESTAMIAVQGPEANNVVASIASIDPAALSYYCGTVCKVDGGDAILSRTGYTGEDGCEMIVHSAVAAAVWQKLHDAAKFIGGGATGLAARDTLRLEAAMPLYGHELSEEINAAQTELRFAINLKGRSFAGRDAIASAMAEKTLPVRVGIELEGRRPAREGCNIIAADPTNQEVQEVQEVIGHLTSGSLSPTLGVPIAMGYIRPQYAVVGTELLIDIRGKSVAAKVVELPFYKRKDH